MRQIPPILIPGLAPSHCPITSNLPYQSFTDTLTATLIMKLSLVSLWAVTATLTAAAPTATTSNHSHSDSSIEKRGPACNIIPGAWRGMDMNSLAVCNLQFAQTGDEEVVVPKNGYTVCTGGTGSFWVHSLGDGELRTAR